MTEVMTSDAVAQETDGLDAVDEQLMRQLTERARAEGLQLTGEGGLLARLTKANVTSHLVDDASAHTATLKTTLA